MAAAARVAMAIHYMWGANGKSTGFFTSAREKLQARKYKTHNKNAENGEGSTDAKN